MIQASTALANLLNTSDSFLMADLFTFTTKAGNIIRATSSDVDSKATIGGTLYTFTSGLKIVRDSVSAVAGIEVDDLSLIIYPETTDLIGTVPFLQAVTMGAFDGAGFTLHRAFFNDMTAQAVGVILRFSGRVSDLDGFSRSEIPVTVKSDLELLNVKMPRNIYQPGCRRTLFDSGCGLTKGAFGFGSAVLVGSTTTTLYCSTGSYSGDTGTVAGWFTLGTVSFTSGANAGVTRTVKAQGSGVLSFSLPLPYAPAAGDTIMIYAGCDKQQGTCSGKFSNLSRFSGEPYIPAAETAY